MTVDSVYLPIVFENDGEIHYLCDTDSQADPTQFEVYKDATLLTLDYHYSLAFSDDNTRVKVRLAAPLAAGSNLRVLRKTPIANPFLAVASNPFKTEAFESAMDKATLIQQEIEGHACACPEFLELPTGTIPPEFVLPTPPPLICGSYECDALSTYLLRIGGWPMRDANFRGTGPTQPDALYPRDVDGFGFMEKDGAANTNVELWIQNSGDNGFNPQLNWGHAQAFEYAPSAYFDSCEPDLYLLSATNWQAYRFSNPSFTGSSGKSTGVPILPINHVRVGEYTRAFCIETGFDDVGSKGVFVGLDGGLSPRSLVYVDSRNGITPLVTVESHDGIPGSTQTFELPGLNTSRPYIVTGSIGISTGAEPGFTNCGQTGNPATEIREWTHTCSMSVTCEVKGFVGDTDEMVSGSVKIPTPGRSRTLAYPCDFTQSMVEAGVSIQLSEYEFYRLGSGFTLGVALGADTTELLQATKLMDINHTPPSYCLTE
jgi:hypothetical protein